MYIFQHWLCPPCKFTPAMGLKVLIEAKNQWIKDQSEEIEQNLNHHNSKKAFEVVKNLTGAQGGETKRKHASAIEDKNGTLLTKVEDV